MDLFPNWNYNWCLFRIFQYPWTRLDNNKLFQMKIFWILPLLIILSCNKDSENNDEKCIDESLIDFTSACIEIYDPVCGCNGITYPNSCYATTFNGVKSFTKGACD